MNKFLLFLSLSSFTLFNANAQDVNISFETSEGYNLGNLVGQNGWQSYGSTYDEFTKVVNNNASHGSNSASVLFNVEEIFNDGGIYYNLPTTSDYSVSADVYFEDLDGSDYYMLTLYSEELDVIAGFYFDYEGAAFAYTLEDYIELQTWTPNTWYNVKVDYDTTNAIIKLYLNNTLVLTSPILADDPIPMEVDFEFDNYFTGFNIDNFKITELDNNMSTNDFNKKSISIYPNPTTDIINVDSKETIKMLDLVDLAGKTLISKENVSTLEVKDLPKGIYLLKITTDKGIETQKILKK